MQKHVDWEIYAALDREADGYSGLFGLMLPTHPSYNNRFSNKKYDPDLLPQRLQDNIYSKYAKFYYWTTDQSQMKECIQDAFEARISRREKIAKPREQMQRNTCHSES